MGHAAWKEQKVKEKWKFSFERLRFGPRDSADHQPRAWNLKNNFKRET